MTRSAVPRALAAALVLALVGAGPARADDCAPSLEPGQDDLLGRTLGNDGPLPGGCSLGGWRWGDGLLAASYRCGTGGREVRVDYAPRAGLGGKPGGAQPTARAPSELPAGLIEALEQRAGDVGAGLRWRPCEGPVVRSTSAGNAGGRSQRTDGRQALWAVALFGLVAAVAQLLAGRERRTAAAAEAPSSLGIRAFAAACATLAAALLLGGAWRFRYGFDDFLMLEQASRAFLNDSALRFVGNDLRLAAGEKLGGRPAFALLNLAAAGGLGWAWWGLLRRAGLPAATALAAATAGLLVAPGLAHLQRMLSGFEQLAAMALVLAALNAFDSAARTRAPKRRLARALLGTFLVFLAVFVKFPVAALAPPAVAAWLLLAVRPRPGLARVGALTGAAGLGWAVPVAVWLREGNGELLKSAGGHGAETFGAAVQVWATLWGALLVLVAGAALAAGVARLVRRRAATAETEPPAGPGSDATAPTTRWPGGREVALLLLLSLVFALPFLLNTSYWAVYYALLASLPVTALGVRAVGALLPAGRLGAAVGLLLAAFVATASTFGPLLESTSLESRLPALLAELEPQVRASGLAPEALVAFDWHLDCAGEPATTLSRGDLEQMPALLSEDEGVRWAVGRVHARNFIAGVRDLMPDYDGAAWRVDYCRDKPLRFTRTR